MIEIIYPVSYTHLAVYKRQRYNKVNMNNKKPDLRLNYLKSEQNREVTFTE